MWIRNNMVIDEAAKLRRDKYGEIDNMVLMLGALCHAFRKPAATGFSEGKWPQPRS